MRLAVVAAGFSPGEADQLRRAMAAWKRKGGLGHFQKKLITGMLDRAIVKNLQSGFLIRSKVLVSTASLNLTPQVSLFWYTFQLG